MRSTKSRITHKKEAEEQKLLQGALQEFFNDLNPQSPLQKDTLYKNCYWNS